MGLRTALGLKQPKPKYGFTLNMPEEGPKLRPKNGWSASYTWYRGEHTNFLPGKRELRTGDGPLRQIISGWEPSAPMIARETRVTAFGSCFAQHISSWLYAKSYSVLTKGGGHSYLVRFGEGMVNTFAIRGQFEWALEGVQPRGEFWHGYDAKAHGYDEAVRKETEVLLRSTDVFIITLGLSEVWFDEPTGEVFWRAVPADKFDPARHRFRVASVSENKQNLHRIRSLIERHVPAAKVIFTLSPIPLVATFRPISCVTASAASKAILRAALDEFLRERADESTFYWPSFEIVREYFSDPFGKDARHVKDPILDYIMTLFEFVWCTEPPSAGELRKRLRAARRADRAFNRPLLSKLSLW